MEKFTLVAFLLLVFCFTNTYYAPNSYAQPVDCLASDREALIDFKDGLDDPANQLSSWMDRKCCQWHGMRCDNRTGAVVAIDLPGSYNRYGLLNLSGVVRPSLMKLKSLRHLDLSLNSFNGIPIPAFLGSLENLQYLNLSYAGFRGKIPRNFGNLSHLKSLDISSEVLSLHAETLKWVTGLVSLEHLALRGVDLSMVGTDWVSAIITLPSLVELHLSDCSLQGHIPILPSLNFTSFAVMDLRSNDIVSKIPDWLVNITSLHHIDISHNHMYGSIPLGFGEMPNLLSLKLLDNENLTANCSQLFRGRWEKTQVLNLAANQIYGKLPSSLGNLTSPVHLDLSDNPIEGELPVSIGKLCNLNFFRLSHNKITGRLPEYLEGIDNCHSRKPFPYLKTFDLSFNQLTGTIPIWLNQLENLVELYFSFNLLEGPIPVSRGSLQKLTSLDLGVNRLNGTLPESIGQLSQLQILSVIDNQLTGVISEAHFSKLSQLDTLLLSSNSFFVTVSSHWIPPFQLTDLEMGSCVLGPSFPAWLKSQNKVDYLDFSNAGFSGFVPNWFWDMSSNMSYLNISHNELQGKLPTPIPIAQFTAVDLSFNKFEGPIHLPTVLVSFLDFSHNRFYGTIPRNIMFGIEFLSFSHNQLQGEIPMSLGKVQSLVVLNLSNNNLTGKVPPSLGDCSSLEVLDLGSNNFFGIVPVSLGQLQRLRSLHLSNNNFWGTLPLSFRNLSNLETIDIGNNRFSGSIPPWLTDGFAHLRILRLRSNAFSGGLPLELSKLNALQVLDLARNNLDGNIPPSLGHLKAIVDERKKNKYLRYGGFEDVYKVYYEESLVVTTKGQSLVYTKTLSFVTSIDLSDNNFTGNLPKEITKLSGLVVLNLSRNHITGQIPEGMSNLHQLSSLDLSHNQLSGMIPSSLASLSFLGYLDLSNNNFSGVIPYTGHMTTFDEPCYVGNPGLCGPPLLVKCPNDVYPSHDYNKGQNNEDANDDRLIDKWFYLSLGLGFAAGILIPYLIFSIKRSWGGVYFAIVDQVVYKILRLW